jgi:hypothetical protein
MDRQPSKLRSLITVAETALGTKSRAVYIINCKIIQVMMQNMYIAYMEVLKTNLSLNISKEALSKKSTIKAKDRVNKLPNRYLKS